MKNIRMYPFTQWAHNDHLAMNARTFYSDIVCEYGLLYGLDPEIVSKDSIIGVQFDANDNEHDIMNFMLIAMGNRNIRAIVVSESEITQQMKSYAIDSTLDTNREFVDMRESVYKGRSIYVRLPSWHELYRDMKIRITSEFKNRLSWHNCSLLVAGDDELNSQDGFITVKFDDTHCICQINFRNPDKLFDEQEIRLHVDADGSGLNIITSGDLIDHKDHGEIWCDQESWLTEVQRLFISDLNKVIKRRSNWKLMWPKSS